MSNQNDNIVDENVKLDTNKDILDIKRFLPKRKNYKVLILSAFISKLKEDKLYFICCIITIIAFFTFSLNKVKDADGVFYAKDNVIHTESNKVVNETIEDELDVTNYVGTYIKEFKLKSNINYGTNCIVSDYKLIYDIKKDKTISKYFYNECVGTVLINMDTLSYVKGENTKNIGTKSLIFAFKGDKLTEFDGLTYTKDKLFKFTNEIIEISKSNLIFIDNKLIIHNLHTLYLINGSYVETEIVNDSLLGKSIFRIGSTNNFKYIVYNQSETELCYEPSLIAETGFEDKESYRIYAVEFDYETLIYKEPVVVVSRKRSDSCDTLNDDLAKMSN